jgi:hypothetical protein
MSFVILRRVAVVRIDTSENMSPKRRFLFDPHGLMSQKANDFA